MAALLVWALWKMFVTPEIKLGKGWRNMVSYYVVGVILLAVSAGLAVAGIRGGFTTAVRPITMSNANQ